MTSDKNNNSNQPFQNSKRQTILFVDPDQSEHELINMILHRSDRYVIVSVYSSEEAIEAARDYIGHIDLLLLDLEPLDLRACELYKELRRDDFLRHVPVIFQTGMLYLPEEIEELIEAEKAEVIYKPFNKEELFTVITKLQLKYEL